jgi:hypothetical protein
MRLNDFNSCQPLLDIHDHLTFLPILLHVSSILPSAMVHGSCEPGRSGRRSFIGVVLSSSFDAFVFLGGNLFDLYNQYMGGQKECQFIDAIEC